MVTTIRTPPQPPPPVVAINGFVFDDVSWDDYEAMLRIIGDRPIRVNYDKGRMEIMSPLWQHGRGSYLLGWMIDVLTEEFDLPIEAGDPVTFKRKEMKKGVEPDKCYYIGPNADHVRGRRELVMGQDPPPDLIIEADITSSSVPRLPIFAALGIPEVWRFDAEGIQFLHLQGDGTYRAESHSRAFPWLAVAEIARFLAMGWDMEKAPWIRQFRGFVRDEVAPRLLHPPEAEGQAGTE